MQTSANEQAKHEAAKRVSDALIKANEQGQPFVLAWRPVVNSPGWLAEYDAGCGCVPVERR